jgi:hypothetical protein
LTLIFALILLVLLTLFGVGAVQLLSVNLRATSNMASQKAAEGAAQQALEKSISNLANFITPPVAPVTVQIANGTSEKFDVTVTGPQCIAELPAAGYSLTYGLSPLRTQWELQAKTKDPTLGGSAELYQGVSILMPAGSCK